MVEHEGLRLQYWRAGHITFSSSSYTQVRDNVQFVRDRFRLTDPAAESHEVA